MKVLLILLTFCFLSSCQKENCEIPDYDLTRKVDIKINTNAEKSLNDLTQILKTGRYLKNLIPENGGCKRLENEIYFNLNQENEILHIKCIYYKNEIGHKALLPVRQFQIPCCSAFNKKKNKESGHYSRANKRTPCNNELHG